MLNAKMTHKHVSRVETRLGKSRGCAVGLIDRGSKERYGPMGTFIIKKTPSGKFNFSLLAANKEKIAVSSQVYGSKASCKQGMDSIARNAKKCIDEGRIEDQTLKNPTAQKCPKFEIYFDKAGLYRYRLIATNGESIAMSEDGYKSKSGCLNGIKSVSVNAPNAEIIDETV